MTDSAAILSHQSRLNHATRVSLSQGPAFPIPGEYADERTDQQPDPGAHVNCLTSSLAFMPDRM